MADLLRIGGPRGGLWKIAGIVGVHSFAQRIICELFGGLHRIPSQVCFQLLRAVRLSPEKGHCRVCVFRPIPCSPCWGLLQPACVVPCFASYVSGLP